MFLPLFDRFAGKRADLDAIIQSITEEIKNILTEHTASYPATLNRYDLLNWEYRAAEIISNYEPRIVKPRVQSERFPSLSIMINITGLLCFTNKPIEIEVLYG